MSLTAGTILGDRFEIAQPLVGGPSGHVYRARDRRSNTDVAVKVLDASLVADEAAREKLFASIDAVSALNQPTLLGALAHGHDEALGVTWIAMELLSGETLRARMTTRPRLPPAEATRFMDSIAALLTVPHARGLLHGALKPENVFFERALGTSRVVLLDVGSAKALSGAARPSAYLAPEQTVDTLWLTPAADVWALGTMLYELVTGVAPFTAATPEDLLVAIRTAAHTPLLKLAPFAVTNLSTFVDRCLSKDPGRRPADALEFRKALAAAFAPPPPPKPSPELVGGRVVSLAGNYKPADAVPERKRGGAVWWVAGIAGLGLLCAAPCLVVWAGLRSLGWDRTRQEDTFASQQEPPAPIVVDPNGEPPAASPSPADTPNEPNEPSPAPSPSDLGPATEPSFQAELPHVGERSAMVHVDLFTDLSGPGCETNLILMKTLREAREHLLLTWRPLPESDVPAQARAHAATQVFADGSFQTFLEFAAELCPTQPEDLGRVAAEVGGNASRTRRAIAGATHLAVLEVSNREGFALHVERDPVVLVDGRPAEEPMSAVIDELQRAADLAARGVPTSEVHATLLAGGQAPSTGFVRRGRPL